MPTDLLYRKRGEFRSPLPLMPGSWRQRLGERVEMQSTGGTHSLLQPVPVHQADVASGIGIARMLGENALLSFPPEAFEEEVVTRRFFGRRQIILSRPAAIQHILIDNPANYRRTTPTMRMLLPLLGRGL